MGMFFAFASALFHAMSNTLVKKGMAYSKNENGLYVTVFVNSMILFLLCVVYRFSIEESAPFNLVGISLFILAGLLTTFIGRLSFFEGIRRIGSARATAIKRASPIFTMIFAFLILQETIGFGPFIGISLIISGLFIQGRQLFQNKQNKINHLGYIFSLCAALSFGIGTVVRKQALLYFADAFTGALIGSLTALVIISFLEARKTKKTNLFSSLKNYLINKDFYYIFAGVLSSFALLCSFLALMFIKAAYLSAIAAAESVLTVILGRLFLNQEETISFSIICSAFVIFLGAGIIALTA